MRLVSCQRYPYHQTFIIIHRTVLVTDHREYKTTILDPHYLKS